ncbi:glycosyltransferase family 2 protein [Balneolaceae bacterium YR4-1]|uniref:Glycosyltransferase family 2 protein n=1 Tax=Halalkalibaculum roseum TaxID=2709311 RepID=A0A6M1SVC0_9BACT|nr:glycosyltransferase family A protein [Halalkalibaculum roseum]NGP76782.1 glycosyltransferase family 2 protein [Halalkalibaculum roseum]
MDLTDSNAEHTNPLVSCLIVTADREALLRRSLHSYKNQTYPNTELVIVDNGHEPIQSLLDEFSSEEVQYIRIDPSEEMVLGDLRNISLSEAKGDYLICWDDDDWFHPKRIEIEFKTLQEGYDACCLTGNLFHIDTEEFMEHPYRGSLPKGSPSSIMHKKSSDIRYPSLPRKEDTVYLEKWRNKKKYKRLDLSYSYLFVRVFHGSNVSSKKHFLRRLKNNPISWVQYIWYAKIKNQLFDHPKFNLTEKEIESFNLFIEDSKKFGLL